MQAASKEKADLLFKHDQASSKPLPVLPFAELNGVGTKAEKSGSLNRYSAGSHVVDFAPGDASRKIQRYRPCELDGSPNSLNVK
jgi:hypothetical protein